MKDFILEAMETPLPGAQCLNSIALISLSLIRLEAPYLLLSKLLSRWVRVIFFEGIRTDGLGVKQSKSKVVLWR